MFMENPAYMTPVKTIEEMNHLGPNWDVVWFALLLAAAVALVITLVNRVFFRRHR